MSSGGRLMYAVSRAIVALASLLVPRWRRSCWRETWDGELWHGSRRSASQAVRRSTGALSHAAWLRWSECSRDGLLLDVRYGLRSLRQQPGFTVVALLVLTLGIGANTTIFSLVNGLLMRPIDGVAAPDRLVGVWRDRPGQRPDNWSYPNYLDIRHGSDAFSGAVAFSRATLTLHVDGALEPFAVQLVSRDYFEVLDVSMARGSGLAPAPGTRDVVLSYGVWQRLFGGTPVIGETLELNGVALRVAGVAAPDFRGLARVERPEAWVAVDQEVTLGLRQASSLDARGNSWLRIVAVLAPGVGLQQARAAAALTTTALREYEVNRDATVLLAPANGLAPDDAGEAGLVLGMLMTVVGLLLLIACANVANLMLARAQGRTQEYGVRLALGASRARLIRQLLVEGLLLSLGAALAGMAVAQWSAGLLMGLFDRIYEANFSVALAPDVRIVVFSFVIAVASVLAFGLAPALRAARRDAALAVATGGKPVGPRRHWAADLSVVGQIALSVVLLVVALLFARSTQAIRAIDTGMATESVLVVTPQSLDPAPEAASPPSTGWRRQLTERIGARAQVTSLAWVESVPLAGLPGRRSLWPPGTEDPVQVPYNTVGPGFFRTAGIPLLLGRDFAAGDDLDAPPVAIINEALAERFWPGEDAVGKALSPGAARLEVVGVVATTKYASLTERPTPFLYLPLEQTPQRLPSLLIRSRGAPLAIAGDVRTALAELPGHVAARTFTTMDQIVASSFGEQALFARVVGLFGLLGLVLAVAGAYGVTSFLVSRRTAEIGVRMALGARAGEIRRSIVRRAVGVALVGVLLGTALAALLTPLLAGLAPAVAPTDLTTFVVAGLSLLVAVALAGWLPARRASRVDPVTALRHE